MSIELFYVFIFNDSSASEIYTLSLHDALPISGCGVLRLDQLGVAWARVQWQLDWRACDASSWRRSGLWECAGSTGRSEEHTSELQSQSNLVCRLLLEKKK